MHRRAMLHLQTLNKAKDWVDSQNRVCLCMNAESFIDTTKLFYRYDLDVGENHGLAAKLLRELWLGSVSVLSTQVLNEFILI